MSNHPVCKSIQWYSLRAGWGSIWSGALMRYCTLGFMSIVSRHGCVGESAPVLPCRHPSMHGGVRDSSACLKRADGITALRAAAVVIARLLAMLQHVVPPDLLRSRGAGVGIQFVKSRRGLLLAGGARYMLLLGARRHVCAVASIAGDLVLKLPVLLVLSAFASPQCR